MKEGREMKAKKGGRKSEDTKKKEGRKKGERGEKERGKSKESEHGRQCSGYPRTVFDYGVRFLEMGHFFSNQ